MEHAEKAAPTGLLTRYRRLPRTVFALSLVSLLNDTSSEIVYPLLPAFLALTLGASPFAIGLIEGFAESVSSILKLFSGYLSDKLGRRKLLVFFGYALAAVTRPTLAFVTSWPQVLAVRTVDRIGKGIRGSPRDALLADSIDPKERGLAFGFNRAADHLGAVFGPIIAFVLFSVIAADAQHPTAREFQRVFLYASIPVAIGLFVIGFFVHEPAHHRDATAEMPKLRFSLREFDGNFKRFLAVIALFTLSNSTDAFLLLRAQNAGVAPAMLPLLWTLLHVSKVLSSLVGGDLSDRMGRKTLIVAGWSIYALVYAAFGFIDAQWQAWFLFAVYGVYFGLTEGVEKALVADLVKPKHRGTAFGLYNLAIGITVLPASLFFGLLWNNFGASTAFLVSAAVSVAAAVLLTTVTTSQRVEA